MASKYMEGWKSKADPKSGGIHLTHKSGHVISVLPNKESGKYEIKHQGKLVGHHADTSKAIKQAVGYFKQNYDKQAPALVGMPSNAIGTKKSESMAKSDYFNKKLSRVKGVHKPYMGQGESFAGEMNQQAQTQNSPVHADMARKLHGQKLKEILGIKPNLPKAELEKAKIDTGKSPEQKTAVREVRNTRWNKNWRDSHHKQGIPKHREHGVHLGTKGESVSGTALRTGDPEQKVINRRDHAKVIADQKAMPKPNLPKSELNKSDYFKDKLKQFQNL